MHSHNLTQYDLIAKVLLVGDHGVGKTSISRRYTEAAFNLSQQMTIGVDFRLKTTLINNKRVKFQIWDYAGSQRFRSLTTSYYRGCHGVLLVFDLTQNHFQENIKRKLREIRENSIGNPGLHIVMFGNKSDLIEKRTVTTEQAEKLAREQGIVYIQGSAKDDVNVTNAFQLLGSDIERTFVPPPPNQRPRPRQVQRWRNEREELPQREEKYGWWGIMAPAVLLAVSIVLALVTDS